MTDAVDDMPDGAHAPGTNCWQVARADRLSVIVDGENYFRAAREAMLQADRRIFLIGWDFDTRITLDRREGLEGPSRLGPFLTWLVKRRPELEVFIQRWDMGLLKAAMRGGAIGTVWRWLRHSRIHMRFDSRHPPGASHHQKIVVVDDQLAFCGGIDMLCDRWDSRGHAETDERRTLPGGKPYQPWHDATTALNGDAAAQLGALCRDRWKHAGGDPLEPVQDGSPDWPESLEPAFTDVDVAICRTWPANHDDRDSIFEIEQLYLDHIAAAKRFIYAESQYFASRKIAEAICKRLQEPDGPEMVLVNPLSAHGWLEPVAMDTARARLVQAMRDSCEADRFRIYHPETEAGSPIYVHAKIFIADDAILRVGSSNMNNRSMRLDTECDVCLDARGPGRDADRRTIANLRRDLMAEHLGARPEDIDKAWEETGSLIGVVEKLRRPSGRTLRPYEVPNLSAVKEWLADNEVLDPEGPGEIFAPIQKRGLFRRRRMAGPQD